MRGSEERGHSSQHLPRVPQSHHETQQTATCHTGQVWDKETTVDDNTVQAEGEKSRNSFCSVVKLKGSDQESNTLS